MPGETRTPGPMFRRYTAQNSKCRCWCRLQRERAIYLTFELDRRWTEMVGVNPLDGTNYLDTVSAFIEGFLRLLAGEGVVRESLGSICRRSIAV